MVRVRFLWEAEGLYDNEDEVVSLLESDDEDCITEAKEMAKRIYEDKRITKERYKELIK